MAHIGSVPKGQLEESGIRGQSPWDQCHSSVTFKDIPYWVDMAHVGTLIVLRSTKRVPERLTLPQPQSSILGNGRHTHRMSHGLREWRGIERESDFPGTSLS